MSDTPVGSAEKGGSKSGHEAKAVVMSRSRPAWRRKLPVILAGVLLIAAALGTLLWVRQDSPDDKGAGRPVTTAGVIDLAKDQKYQRNYDEAARLTEERYNQESDARNKYLLALKTATAYESAKKYQQAIEWYQKADALTPNEHAAMAGLAFSYRGLGDKAKAAEYFRKAIAAIDRDVIGADNDVQYYESLLAEVEGRPAP